MSDSVLITGGTGFVGAHLAEQLLDDGHDVALFDTAPSTDRLERLDIAEAVDVVVGDVRDREALADAIDGANASRIVHLAAILGGTAPLDTRATVNAGGPAAVLDAADRAGVDRIVLASSETVYAPDDAYDADEVPEDSLLRPESPYAAAKLHAERLVHAYADERDLSAVALRPTGVFGPWGHGIEFDELFERPARGERVTVGPADGAISWLYVRDAANAFAAAATAPAGDLSRRVYNVRGEHLSIREVAAIVRDATDAELTVENGDPLRWSAQKLDISAAQADLGYEIDWPVERFVSEYVNLRAAED